MAVSKIFRLTSIFELIPTIAPSLQGVKAADDVSELRLLWESEGIHWWGDHSMAGRLAEAELYWWSGSGIAAGGGGHGDRGGILIV